MKTVVATRTFAPADHGRRVSVADLDAAEYAPGFKYEVIDGRLYVSPQPNPPEHILERWLRRKLERYSDDHPEVIDFIAVKGRVFLPASRRLTVPEPDIAAYSSFPFDLPSRDIKWEDLSPCLVVEVLVDGDIGKDLTRNPRLYLKVPSIREYWVLDGTMDPDEPSLIRHVRKGKRWEVETIPFGSLLMTKLLPGFQLVLDPHR